MSKKKLADKKEKSGMQTNETIVTHRRFGGRFAVTTDNSEEIDCAVTVCTVSTILFTVIYRFVFARQTDSNNSF